jgi:chromosomal replication initiator protein
LDTTATAEIETFWSSILAGVQEKIGVEKVHQWLVPTVPIAQQGTHLRVEVPNYYFRYWIEENYIELIEKTASHLAGEKFFVDLVIAGTDKTTASAATTFSIAQADYVAASLKPPLKPIAPQIEATLEKAGPTNGNGGPILNARYTFDTFVIGNNNRFAHAAALAVADTPNTYNPLFIYGSSGLGKTHLMQAIGHFVKEHSPATQVYYVSSEKFTNELIASIGQGNNNVNSFRNRYRNVDVLLIDDIQFIAGKERTQEEFFHTFNSLHESGKQIVITSDRPPKDIPQLEERLRSRFEWGLICDIQKPDLETRTAILQNKTITDNLDISLDILTYVARKIDTNIRELEGVLNRVVMYSRAYNEPINSELIDKVLKNTNPELSRSKVTTGQVLDIVSTFYGISLTDLKSKKRTQEVVLPRQIAMFLCHQLIDISFPRLGEEFGGRDHTTVMHACTKISGKIKAEKDFALIIKELTDKIESR